MQLYSYQHKYDFPCNEFTSPASCKYNTPFAGAIFFKKFYNNEGVWLNLKLSFYLMQYNKFHLFVKHFFCFFVHKIIKKIV
jgi:hypothetical protein